MVVGIIIGLIILFLYIFRKKVNIKNVFAKELLKLINRTLLIALIIEIIVFNFRSWESIFFKKETLPNYNLYGIHCLDTCRADVDNYLEINNLNTEIHNIYLKISSDKTFLMNYEIFFTDEANSIYLDAGARDYASDIRESHYIKVNPSGKIGNLKIKINSLNHDFKIEEIAINSRVPFHFNILRFIVVSLFFLAIFIINPKNKLHEIKYNFKNHKIITLIVILVIGSIFSIGTLFNVKTYTVKRTSHYSQYKNLARSLAHGSLSLNLQVDERLNNLINPYDTVYRDSILNRYNDYYWDYAFYNGKYYSYFGIVPCLLTYFPFYLITHQDLPNNIAISIGIFLYLLSVFSLVYTIIKRYFAKTSYINYIFLSIFMALAGGLANFSGEPTFYNLPIIFGVSFALLGLNCYLLATREEKLKGIYLFWGSLFFALVAGCRPQLLLTFILGLVIIWPYIFKSRELFSRKSLKNTILFIMPFIVIGLFLMAYNYFRFDSILDFGANYNLTTNDMTKRGFKFDRTGLGLFHFLFAPTKINLIFPFINTYKIATSYLGKTIYEKMYGGFFFMNIICLLSLFPLKFKNLIKNSQLTLLNILMVILAIVIVIFDTQMAGILPRYIGDFGFLLALSTVIIILAILNSKTNIELKKIITTLLFISIIYNLLTFFLARNLFANEDILRLIFYKIYYAFMFWL